MQPLTKLPKLKEQQLVQQQQTQMLLALAQPRPLPVLVQKPTRSS